MKVAIIKYNAGNTRSVLFALERIGIHAILTDNASEIATADKIIFPGVGEASTAMNYLREHALDKLIISLKQPILGICLGMQLLCNYSEEGNTHCLGIFNTTVKRFPCSGEEDTIATETIKVPQMGWNLFSHNHSPLFNGISQNSYVYFVHSYYAGICEDSSATTTYGNPYSSALHKRNFYGLQFHPEKSSTVGQKILENFIKL